MIIQEASKIAAFFDPYFKKIVYFEQSLDEILAPIRENLPTNLNSIVQPSYISRRLQFIHEFSRTSTQLITSNSDELIQY
ncbi:5583_t:CDS:1 [Scutellospora calospora]|uniref:5583_t:CDS:1 n=1 Tax=Scutellospora calospora TaxID=85575 RepID=A0ACA9NNC9_9GLOM|nr:5583_t:CDS:1 [Scutellospora calospora]